MQQPLVIAAPDVIAEQQRWLTALIEERRLSDRTAEAYERDLRQFLGFLTSHLGGPPNLSDLADLRPLLPALLVLTLATALSVLALLARG